MQLDPRESAAVFTALCAWLAFLVASILPVWTVRYFNEWDVVGESGTLWSALARLPQAIGPPHTTRRVLEAAVSLYGGDLILALIALAVGSVVGRFTYWWVWGR